MSIKLLHIVATRMFTTLLPEHDEKWLFKRLDIFATFTLPSLTRQSCNDFYWVLLVSSDLQSSILAKLYELISPYSNIYIIQLRVADLHDQPEYDLEFDSFITQHQLDYEFLLSSRIDGDDAWSIDYVERVQQNARQQINYYQSWQDSNGLIMNFPYGNVCYPFSIRSKEGIGIWRRKFFSQSVDVLTMKGKLDTFYKFPHSKTRLFAKNNNFKCCYYLTQNPMWLYVQHAQNDGLLRKWHHWFTLFEKFAMRFKPLDATTLAQFGIELEQVKEFKSCYLNESK